MLKKLRKLGVRAARAARFLAMNAGILPSEFILWPDGRSTWKVRAKRPDGPQPPRWYRIRLRPGTADLSTFVDTFIQQDYSLRRLGRYPEIHAEYERILQDGRRPLIVDCGANIGLVSLYLSLCFPQALVLGVEPEQGNYSFAANHLTPNIRLHRAAVSNVDGQLAIANPRAEVDAFRVEHAQQATAETVPGYSMDSLIALAGQECDTVEPFLAKFDIEGFEDTVFASHTDWIDRFKVLAIELHDYLLPGRACSRHFLRAVSRTSRDFLYGSGLIFSIRNGAAPSENATVGTARKLMDDPATDYAPK